VRDNVQGQKLAGEETKLLATQRQPTYSVAPTSSLRGLYFVVLRLIYVIDIEELTAVSVVSQALIIPRPRPTILAPDLDHGRTDFPQATSVGVPARLQTCQPPAGNYLSPLTL
jgi:hypothetical protein